MSVKGRSYPPVRFRIEAEAVAAFARTVGADPDAGVPPTYAAVYALGMTAPQLFGDGEAAVNFSMLVHAEQEFEWERHPEVGEEVTAQATVVDDFDRRGMRFLTLETVCTDEAGRPLCRSRMLDVIRA